MARIEIDPHSGFCPGVVAAIRKAEAELSRSSTLYCLGDIVHNSAEVERLRAKGLVTIDHERLGELSGVSVLLRAHGEPPSTYAVARTRGIRVVDATCGVVLKLQQRIKAMYDLSRKEHRDVQILIYGRRGHAEVNGLVGQTEGTAIVIEGVEGLDRVDYGRDIALYSQTTKSLEGFREVISEIERRIEPGVCFEYFDTICRQVSNRVEYVREFASSHEVVVFVSGAKSSNGRVLYEHCLSVNERTMLIAGVDDIDEGMLKGVNSVGICGATSTPRWLMEQVAERVKEILG